MSWAANSCWASCFLNCKMRKVNSVLSGPLQLENSIASDTSLGLCISTGLHFLLLSLPSFHNASVKRQNDEMQFLHYCVFWLMYLTKYCCMFKVHQSWFSLVCVASVLLQILLVFVLKRLLSAFQRQLFSFVIKPHYFFITDLVEPSLLNWIIWFSSSWTFNTISSLYCSVFFSVLFFSYIFIGI